MPTTHGLDPWRLVLNASPVVKMVLALLVVMSVVCWFIIGAKVAQVRRARRESQKFLGLFWDTSFGQNWNAQRFEAIYSKLKNLPHSPLARVFHAGYIELARIASAQDMQQAQRQSQRPDRGGDLDNVERALKRAANREVTDLESMVPFLATTGSTAPFVGLFGTVWGIMGSFLAIGGQHNASLDVVAPGIAEALIATAVGLLAAIPAVMAYNFFVRRIHVFEGEVDAFCNDCLNIVRRHLLVG